MITLKARIVGIASRVTWRTERIDFPVVKIQQTRQFFAKAKAHVEGNKYFQYVSAPFNKWYVRRTLRVAQVATLTFMVFQAGYQRGVVAFSKDPEKFEAEMMNWVLGPSTTNSEYFIYHTNSDIYMRVERVAHKVLESARIHCQRELEQSRVLFNQLEVLYRTDRSYKGALNEAEEKMKFWQNAHYKVHGNWSVVVSNHLTPNAFVTGFCPRKIFVFEGLIQCTDPSDDELAMILGHEISHVILGHTDEEVPSDAILLGVELIIMSLVDPVGIWTFIFDVYLNKLRQYITASYSRANEEDADALGIQIAGKACFNLSKGVNIFKKLADLDKRTSTTWADTHPASIERYQKLAEFSKQYDTNNGYMDGCGPVQSDFIRLIGFAELFGYGRKS